MGNLANTQDTYQLELNLSFTKRLLQLLNAYYDSDDPRDILKQVLIELGKQANSTLVGLVDHEDPSQSVVLNVLSESEEGIVFDETEIPREQGSHFQAVNDRAQLSFGIVNSNEVSWTVYLNREEVFNELSLELVKIALPVLKAMLSGAKQQRIMKAKVKQYKNKTSDLQALIESLDDMIVEMDGDAVIKKVWIKDKTKLFMPPELFIDQGLMSVFGDFGKIFMDCIEKLLLTGERQECIYPDFDASKHHWYCAKFQKIDADQNSVRIIGVIEDITAKKDMSDQLEQSAYELKRINLELLAAKNLAEQIARKRTETLSIMSHEIRTPLNGIIGICNLLSQTLFSDHQTIEYIDHLNLSSNHLLHLVNDILDLEKIESRKMELNETETDLVALVCNVKKQFLPQASAKKLDLNLYHDDEIPPLLMVDDLRLGRILNNLIGNAIKFTEKGGVSISLKTVLKGPDLVSVLFKISDTGIGIPDHLHNLIFDKFHQVQQASHRQQQGTGLGLSITKGLINLFKSEIYLVSKQGEGTTFEFQIDFKPCMPREIRKVSNSLALGLTLPEFELLIVDDNPVNLLVASRQLDRFGIKADQADGGYTALERLKEKQYDIVLVDLHMPGMDGYELAGRIRTDYPATKVIIFTADILEEVRARLKEMGILHILSKPFSPHEMYRVFLEVLK